MDYYLSLTSGNCKSRHHVKALYDCAYPPIEWNDSVSVYEQHEQRKGRMFFSQGKLREHFGDVSQIKDLLDCSCQDCIVSQRRLSGLDIEKLSKTMSEAKDGPLLLAVLVNLSKLHFVYHWATSGFRQKPLSSAAQFFKEYKEVRSHFVTNESKSLFDSVCQQALEMFDPVRLDFAAKPHPSYTTYEPV